MSSSKSSSATKTLTEDRKVAGDNGAIGITTGNGDGDVGVYITADEAFELGEIAIVEALNLARQGVDIGNKSNATLSTALVATQQAAKSEAGQIGEQLIKIGVPAAALAFVAYGILK